MKTATILVVVAVAMFCLYMAMGADPAIGQKMPAAQAATGPGQDEMIDVPIRFPNAVFVGTPPKPPEKVKLDLREKIPPVQAPRGVVNLALNRPVSSSDKEPIEGKLEMVTDGDKEAGQLSYVELNPGTQWVQIDLGKPAEIWAVAVWHEHASPFVYKGVVVQVCNDADFIDGVRTLYNNDADNALGMGVGNDLMYYETSLGRVIEGKGVRARYVRLYSRGHLEGDESRYTEVEVYGRP